MLHRWRMFALGVTVLAIVGVSVFWTGRNENRAQTSWRSVAKLRGLSIARIPLRNGTTLDVGKGTNPHLLYLFRTDCAVCAGQRTYLAGLLASISPAQFISGAPESADSLADYWTDSASPVAPPVAIDSLWLRRADLTELPLLLFISPTGRISRAVTGSILSWSPQTLVNELRRAATADQTLGTRSQ